MRSLAVVCLLGVIAAVCDTCVIPPKTYSVNEAPSSFTR